MPTTTSSRRRPSRRRPCAAVGLGLFLTTWAAFAAAPMPGSHPTRIPATGDVVLATLPGQDIPQHLEGPMRALAEDPENVEAATAVARHYLEIASARSDPRYAGYARAALAPWWTLDEPPAPVLRLRARYRQHRHDFTGALADLERLLARRPHDAGALLLMASVQRVRGDLAAAGSTCERLRAVTRSAWGDACRIEIAALTGALETARAELRSLLGARETGGALRAWLHTLGAEMALQAGDPGAAIRHLETARAETEGTDTYRLGLHADALLSHGDPAAARRLLEAHTDVDALLLRLAIAERRLGDPAWRTHHETLEARFAAAARRGDSLHWRERARAALVLADAPERAVAAAQRNWQTQRELADARLLARAAVASGRPETAEPVYAWMQRHGTQDRALATALKTAGLLTKDSR